MSALIVLRQPRACLPKDGAFRHAPSFAWFVHAIAGEEQYAGIAEADVLLENLEFFGQDSWSLLQRSGLFDTARLASMRDMLTLPDGSCGFYPVARLRSSNARALAIPGSHSPAELACLNNQLLSDLAVNRFKLSREARSRLGSGDLPSSSHPNGASNVELLELELSDSSLLVGWGWVWYRG